MGDGEAVRLLTLRARAERDARGRPLTPADFRAIFRGVPSGLRVRLSARSTGPEVWVGIDGRWLATFDRAGVLKMTYADVPAGTPSLASREFAEGRERFGRDVRRLAVTRRRALAPACGRRPRARAPRARSRRVRASAPSRAGPGGDDGSGLDADPECPAGRAEARRYLAGVVA